MFSYFATAILCFLLGLLYIFEKDSIIKFLRNFDEKRRFHNNLPKPKHNSNPVNTFMILNIIGFCLIICSVVLFIIGFSMLIR